MIRKTMARGRQHLLLLALALLAGCAGTQSATTRDAQLGLRERVAQYWDARVKGDLLATYTIHEPAFRRAVTLTAFLQGRGVIPVFSYEILDDRVDGDLGLVKVKIQATIVHPQLVKPVEPSWYEFEEQWVRVDGAWYRKFRFPIGDPYPDVNWDDIAAKKRTLESPPVR